MLESNLPQSWILYIVLGFTYIRTLLHCHWLSVTKSWVQILFQILPWQRIILHWIQY